MNKKESSNEEQNKIHIFGNENPQKVKNISKHTILQVVSSRSCFYLIYSWLFLGNDTVLTIIISVTTFFTVSLKEKEILLESGTE